MEIKKPEIKSERERYLCNQIYYRLKERVWTKEELCKEFHLNERVARDIISKIAKKFPVITPGKGYKIAQNSPEDALEKIHKIRDFDSRVNDFGERKKPLWESLNKDMEERGIVSLSEFERVLKQEVSE